MAAQRTPNPQAQVRFLQPLPKLDDRSPCGHGIWVVPQSARLLKRVRVPLPAPDTSGLGIWVVPWPSKPKKRVRVPQTAPRPHSRVVKTPACHAGSAGSIPAGAAISGVSIMAMHRALNPAMRVQFSHSLPLGRGAAAAHSPDKGKVAGSNPAAPTIYAGVVQLAERLPCKQRVGGSSPLAGSI